MRGKFVFVFQFQHLPAFLRQLLIADIQGTANGTFRQPGLIPFSLDEELQEGFPLQAVAAMRGRIWRRVIEKTELHELKRAQSVISTKLLAGRTVVRVHSATSPGAGFDFVEPELEDVYFSTMAGHYGGRGEQPVLEAAR